jgi:hypothetical protein
MSSWGWSWLVLEKMDVVRGRESVGESSEGQCEGGLERGVWRMDGSCVVLCG